MVVGIPRERKIREYRVVLNPQAVRVLVADGHRVLVERSAGAGSGIGDDEYAAAGAELVETEEELFERAELIVKVKELQPEEWPLLKSHHVLFSYIHLASDERLKEALAASGATVVAFETVELDDGSLPLLVPMSSIAGKLSIQEGSHFLERPYGGKGVILSGAPGVRPAKVTVIGGGTVGRNAVITALGMRADVTVIDKNLEKLKYFYDRFSAQVTTRPSYPEIVAEEVASSDLVVGAVLVTGARAPKVVTAEMIEAMEEGSVFVDIAIDQGGCSETSRPTTLDDPVYVERGVIHYCVTNVPSLVSRTSTFALSAAVLPYLRELAAGRLRQSPPLKRGVNVEGGRVLI